MHIYPLTPAIHWWLGGAQYLRHAGPHVQLSQCELVHEVRQLERDKNVADLGKIKIKTYVVLLWEQLVNKDVQITRGNLKAAEIKATSWAYENPMKLMRRSPLFVSLFLSDVPGLTHSLSPHSSGSKLYAYAPVSSGWCHLTLHTRNLAEVLLSGRPKRQGTWSR